MDLDLYVSTYGWDLRRTQPLGGLRTASPLSGRKLDGYWTKQPLCLTACRSSSFSGTSDYSSGGGRLDSHQVPPFDAGSQISAKRP